MALVNNDIISKPIQQAPRANANNAKPAVNANDIFMFEDANGKEHYYLSIADYQADIQDGKIDGSSNRDEVFGLSHFEDENDKFLFGEYEKFRNETKTLGQGMSFGEYKTLTAEEIAAYYEQESNSAATLTERRQENIDSIDRHKSVSNNNTSKDKEVINEKNEKIDELKKEIKEQEKAEKAAQEEELAKAIKKAEKEYDPAKHGDNKDAYIKKQTAGIIDSAKGQTTELKDQLKTLEAEVKNLFGEIANRNKISRQNSFTKLNMNIQNTFSTAATAEAESYKATTLSLSA